MGIKGCFSVEEFMEQIVEGWKGDMDIFAAGIGNEVLEKWYETFGETYSKAGG